MIVSETVADSVLFRINGWTNDKDHPFMVVGMNFPTLGCWEIKGSYHDAELTFVIWVAA